MAPILSAGQRSGQLLQGKTAADVMTPNPISLPDDAPIPEAITLFLTLGFQAAPVIDQAGRPVGVLSQIDILIHEREAEKGPAAGENLPPGKGAGGDRVGDIMTPAIFAVPLDYPAPSVVDDLIRLKVHQLFVVDPGGVLVGVVSCRDILRHTRPAGSRPA